MRIKMFSGVTGLSACLLAAGFCTTTAQDWPQWRGPNHDGCSPESGLLKEWPAGGPKLAWKATGLGAGYAGLALVGDRIYTLGDKDGNSTALALNRADGKLVWAAKVGKAGAPGWGGFAGPRSTPTFDDGRLFTLGHYGEVAAFDAATGKELWRADYVKDLGGKMPEWAFSESLLVDGDRVVGTPGGEQGTLVAFDKKTGKVLWRSKEFTDNAQYSSVIGVTHGGVRQYIQMTDKSVAGVAANDGRLLWKAPRKGSTAVIPTPIFDEGRLYVTSGYGIGCNLFKVTAQNGAFQAEQVYANKVMVNHHGGAILVKGHVYGYSDGKGWTCQNLATGEAVWQDKESLGKGSLTYADGCFILRQEDKEGTVALIEATSAGYKEKGRFDQPDRTDKNSWTHPTVAGGKLYIRDQDLLLCYDLKAK